MDGQLSHRPGKATNLIRGLALGAQAGEQCPGESRVEIASGKLLHQVVRLLLFEVVSVQQAIEELTVVHDASCRMKFAIRASPSGVSTLSG